MAVWGVIVRRTAFSSAVMGTFTNSLHAATRNSSNNPSHIFQQIQKDPTNKYQQHITKALQNSSLIIQRNQVKHLIQRKPRPPSLNAQIKIRKPDNPIRPVVNNRHAPACTISKFMAKKLNDHLKLKNL
jgi:hypothetical protein